jgi:hypothetical protein
MDLRLNGVHPCPETLSPRRMVCLHRNMTAALNRRRAADARATFLAIAAGVNGGKAVSLFDEHVNRLMKREVVKLVQHKPAEDVENSDDYESASQAALEQAKMFFAMKESKIEQPQ